jgi:translocator protein
VTSSAKIAVYTLILLSLAVFEFFIFRNNIQNWYVELIKPSIHLPLWIFPIVWVVLLICMSVSFYLIWDSRLTRNKQIAVLLFLALLLLLILRPVLLLGLKNPGLAELELLPLWLIIFMTMFYFSKIRRVAGVLLLPLLMWISYVGIVNILTLALN